MDHSPIIGIYLAAGQSSRMGSNKLNLPIGKERVGSIAFRAALASKLTSTIAVTRKGVDPQWLAHFFHNPGWSMIEAEGSQSDSLKTGLNAAMAAGAKGVIVLLADQPFVTTLMVNRLLFEADQARDHPFISYFHNGYLKPPLYLSSRIFPLVMDLDGDKGARDIIRNGLKGKKIKGEENIAFLDIDTKEDYDYIIESIYINNSQFHS